MSSNDSSSAFIKEILDTPKDFLHDGQIFLNRCTKPDRKEFLKIAQAVGVGFLVMGTIGYFVKLIHIPVNNILVGGA
ncbi:MAG: Sec61p translocation complex subunit [Chrysothrix sp. TS-e1954]|nr:MAG: Sec61p translocation complex subunit [Chrysothrix sp. TS-e1954]